MAAEALAAIERAVGIYRRLPRDTRDANRPVHANALFLYGALRPLKPGGALKAVRAYEEAAAIYRQLSVSESATYLPKLAMTLAYLSVLQNVVEQNDDAAAATKELFAILPRLADVAPAELTRVQSVVSLLPAQTSEIKEQNLGVLHQLVRTNLDGLGIRFGVTLMLLADQLASTGRLAEAVVHTQSAVDYLRARTATLPTQFLEVLAEALVDLTNRLGAVGRLDEAMQAGAEAGVVFRQIDSTFGLVDPAEGAESLAILSSRLYRAGRTMQALTLASESVELYRQLASDGSPGFSRRLAEELVLLGARLCESGRETEADALINEAGAVSAEMFTWDTSDNQSDVAVAESVAILRRLSAVGSTAHLPRLAAAVCLHIGVLHSAGRPDEALDVLDEYITIQHQLTASEPQTYLPELAASFWTRGVWLNDRGRHEEALLASGESVHLYRELANGSPPTHSAELSKSLISRAIQLAAVARHEEATAAASEAIEILGPGSDSSDTAVLVPLAQALTVLDSALYQVGRKTESLEVSSRTVRVCRQLTDANPAAHTVDLVQALTVYGIRLCRAGQKDNGRSAFHDAVDLCRTTAAADASQTAVVAQPFLDISGAMRDCGLRREARAVAEEAIALYSQLAFADPDQYLYYAIYMTAAAKTLVARWRIPRSITFIWQVLRATWRLRNATEPGEYDN